MLVDPKNDHSERFAPPKAALADFNEGDLSDNDRRMPRTALIAIVLLWTSMAAYGIGAALSWTHSPFNKFLYPFGLAFWTIVIYFIGRRSRAARIVLLVSTLLIIPLLAAQTYLVHSGTAVTHAPFYLARLVTVYGCRVAATFLLFSRKANAWYRGGGHFRQAKPQVRE